MKLKVVGLISFLCLLTNSASAGFLVDPYVGISSSKSTLDLPDENEDSNSLTVLGSRLGYSFLLFSAGIDYQKASNTDIDATNLSAFVGFDLPILLRVWAEYFISSDLKNSDVDGSDFSFKSGYSVGAGFTGLPFVSLNLEIEALKYTSEIDGLSEDPDLDVANIVFSVSLPLDL